ncbi:hypothetical protein [Luteimonas salinilitoris]|uniref:Uncharacterized protein n=1 Tax=Luteimonas salinilitoris TaxID=3237697 RepID=A0ABV4HU09_9GAMM
MLLLSRGRQDWAVSVLCHSEIVEQRQASATSSKRWWGTRKRGRAVHRLSMESASDPVTTEEGRPDELVEQDALFARLWKRQTGGFILEEIS